MAARSGLALRLVQWFIRAVEFGCAVLILALFSYFLATLRSHNIPITTWIKAVEGIAGAATLYTILCLLFLCCVAGHPFLSSILLVLDICFVGAFIYLASANRAGASSCSGIVDTPYGRGNADTNMMDNGQGGGITDVPSLRTACKMQTACLAVAIVGIFFFIFSALLELALMRHRRKAKRFGPSPTNGYTSGYGYGHDNDKHPKRRGGLLGSIFSRKRQQTGLSSDDPNRLPAHPHPEDLHRASYGTEDTRVNTSHGGGDVLPPMNTTARPLSGVVVDTGYGNYTYKQHPDDPATTTTSGGAGPYDGDSLGAYTHHTEFANTGGAAANPSMSPTTTARFPSGNYRYDDGVYDRF